MARGTGLSAATRVMRDKGEAKRYSSGLWELSSRELDERDRERMNEASERSSRQAWIYAALVPLFAIWLICGQGTLLIAGFLTGLVGSLFLWNARLARSFAEARKNPKIFILGRDEGDLGPAYVIDSKVHNLANDEVLETMEILGPNITWKLNGKEVKPAIAKIQQVALPSKTIGFNRELVLSSGEYAERDLTTLEIYEIRRVAGKMMRNSLLFQVAVLMAIVMTPFVVLSLIATVNGGLEEGGAGLLVCGAVLVFFFGAGLIGDKGAFRESMKLRKAAKNGYAVMIKDALDDDGVFAYVAEYLSETGGIWTVDGEPAEWRLEYITG